MSNSPLFVLDEAQAKALGNRLFRASSLLHLLVRHIHLSTFYAEMKAEGVEELLTTILEGVEQIEGDLEPTNLDRLGEGGRVIKAHPGPVLIRQGVAHV